MHGLLRLTAMMRVLNSTYLYFDMFQTDLNPSNLYSTSDRPFVWNFSRYCFQLRASSDGDDLRSVGGMCLCPC